MQFTHRHANILKRCIDQGYFMVALQDQMKATERLVDEGYLVRSDKLNQVTITDAGRQRYKQYLESEIAKSFEMEGENWMTKRRRMTLQNYIDSGALPA